MDEESDELGAQECSPDDYTHNLQNVLGVMGAMDSMAGDPRNIILAPQPEWKQFLDGKCLALTKEQEKGLRRCYKKMIQYLDINDFLDYLYQDGAFKTEDIDKIRSQTTPMDRVRAMLDILKTRGQKAYFSFARAFYLESPQYRRSVHIVHPQNANLECSPSGQLCLPSQPGSLSILSISHEVPNHQQALQYQGYKWRQYLDQNPFQTILSEENRGKLLAHYTALVRSITSEQLKQILFSLRCDGILSQEQEDTLLAERTQWARNRQLIRYVEMKGDLGFFSLVHAIVNMPDHHGEEANTLQQGRVISRDDDQTVSNNGPCHAQPYSEGQQESPPGVLAGYIEQQKSFFKQKLFSPQGPFSDPSKHVEAMIYVAQKIEKSGVQGLEEITKSKVFKTKCKREVKPDELFTALEDLGEQDDPRTVLLHGPPGIGKTSLCYKLLHDITQNKLFPDKIPFLIRLRDINLLSDKMSFKQLLLEKHGRKYGGENWMDTLYTQIEEVGSQVAIIIDGYDESRNLGANPNPEYLETTSDVDTADKPEKLIYSLIEGSILPKAKLFITSRSYAIDSLKGHVQRVMELEGFSQERLMQLFEREFGEKRGQQVLNYLKVHPRLMGLCYVPRHAQCFISFLKSKGLPKIGIDDIAEPIPQSMAHLMFCLLIQIIKDSCDDLKRQKHATDQQVLERKRALINALCDLAYSGLFSPEDVKQVFTSEEAEVFLHQYNLTITDLGNSIMSCYELLWEDMLTNSLIWIYMFPHLLIQEWCTAVTLLKKGRDELTSQITHMSGTHEVAWLLYFGLSEDPNLCRPLKILLNEDDVYIEELTSKAQQVIRAYMQHTRLTDQSQQLFCINALSEGSMWHMADEVALMLGQNGTKNEWVVPIWLSSAEAVAVGKFLSSLSQGFWCVDISDQMRNSKYMVSEEATQGYSVLRTNELTPETTSAVKAGHVSMIEITERGRNQCPQNLPPVTYLHQNNISSQSICNNISRFSNVQTLMFSDSYVGPLLSRDPTGSPVLCALQQLKHLGLQRCGIKDPVIPVLIDVVLVRKLEYLSLRGNYDISARGAKALAICLQRADCSLKALSVWGCNISHKGCDTLYQAACKNTTVQILHMGHNKWNGLGSGACNAPPLHEMYVGLCPLTSVDCSCTRVLCIEYITVTLTLVDSLVAGISTNNTLQCLSLYECELTFEHMERLTDALVKCTTLTALDLSRTTVPVACITKLITHAHLTALNVSNCNLSKQDSNAVGHAVCTSTTLCWVGIGEYVKPDVADLFLLRLQQSYPASGPLQEVCVLDASGEAVRYTDIQLHKKLAKSMRTVYTVSLHHDMYRVYHYHLLQEGYEYSCLPQQLRRLLWKASHYLHYDVN